MSVALIISGSAFTYICWFVVAFFRAENQNKAGRGTLDGVRGLIDPNLTEKGFKAELTKKKDERKEKPEKQKEQVYLLFIYLPIYLLSSSIHF